MKFLFLLLNTLLLLSATELPNKMSVQEKKARFIKIVLPEIERVYSELDTKYHKIQLLIKNGETNSTQVQKLMKSYSASSPEDLLERIKPHAKSVALAQAAIESAWATSRFYKEANNLFGIWARKKSKNKISANEKRGKKTIYIKKYTTLYDSVRDYYKILATVRAYRLFRQEKIKSNNPYLLTRGLNSYSEIGAEYGKRLNSMIRHNKFYKIDE